MEEQELTELCRQGNNRARKELYEQYSGRMLGICLRYAGDRDTAQDLVHDGFLKIFASFDKFTWRGEGSLRAWMERVMVNVALQYLRKNDVMNQAMALDEAPETYEIAQLLGINEKSSASQLFRAKSVLARRVKEWLMVNDR